MFLVLLLLLWCVLGNNKPGYGKAFNPDLLEVVDKVGDNYLIRGNYPSRSYFEMTLEDVTYVRNEIESFAVSHGYPEFPANYSFNTINLESYDFVWVLIEEEFFKKHPYVGEFRNWPLLGTLENATKLSEHERNERLDSGKWEDLDHLPSRTEILRGLLETKYDKPAVFYEHCFLGVDRAGELAGSYQMRYLNWNYTYLWYRSSHMKPGRTRKIVHTWACMMNWMCYYIERKFGRNLDCGIWYEQS